MDNHQEETNHAGAQSRAGEAGANLTDELGIDPEERYLHGLLARLQEDYAKAAKPILDRLAVLHYRRPLPPVMVTLEQAKALGIEVPNAKLRGAL